MLYSTEAFLYTTGQYLSLEKGTHMNMYPIILMVNGKTRYSKVSIETTDRIRSHVDIWKSEWGINTLLILSTGGTSTQSTAWIVQSSFGAGSRVVPYLQNDATEIARKAANMSHSDPVVVIAKDSLQLHRIARALDAKVEHNKFDYTHGVVIDMLRRTSTPFSAE